MGSAFNSQGAKRKPTINITSLVDVLFLLLIFFMVSSTFKDDEQAIDITLPKAQSATEQELDAYEIRVDQGGLFYLDALELDEGALRDELVTLLESDPDARLVLRADSSADFGRVIRAIDIAREVGVVNLIIPTDPLEDTPEDR